MMPISFCQLGFTLRSGALLRSHSFAPARQIVRKDSF
jgi:hypothetical protein